MFQVILIFSDYILIKRASYSYLHPFHLGGNRFSKNSNWSFDCGTGVQVKIYRFNAFYRNLNTIKLKIFSQT